MGAARVTHGLGWTDVSAVRLDNRFGAAGFYGPYPSYEETVTDALWTVTALRAGAFRNFPTECRFSFKRHDDEFTLFRERPDFYRNRNITRTGLFQSTTRLLQSGGTTIAAALEFAGSTLESSRMGRHSIRRGSAAVEVQQEIRPGWVVEGSLRFDGYSTWGGRWTPGAGCSYFLRPDLKLRGYYGQAFRTPTFTELYYLSPGDRGDPALAPETAQTVEGGADWYVRPELTFSITVFHRWDRDMIDWIRRDPAGPWQASNIGEVDVSGCSLLASGTLAGIRFQGGYSWNDLDAGPVDYRSKYALNYARHHFSALLTAPLGRRTWLNAAIHFKERSDGQAYVPACMELRHSWKDLEFFARVDNLFDEDYEEIPGVAMPGRSCAGGVRFYHSLE
jgi:iron complex outermembrane receptor protein